MHAILQFLSRNTYRKEITCAIILKLGLLGLLWHFCFAHPVTEQLTNKELTEHYK